MPNSTFRTIQTNFLEGVQNARNYIPNSNIENGSTNGWALGLTGTLTNAIPTGSPTFGSGTANLTLSASSSSPQSGTYSLSLAASAATTAGNMLHTDAITIDAADQAKILGATFYFSVPSNPSNGNFSGTSSNSFGIAAYDVTNSVWLPVVGQFSMIQNSGVGIDYATMQTDATTATIRFCVYAANASAGAITVNFDRIQLGPNPNISTPSSITPITVQRLTSGSAQTYTTPSGVKYLKVKMVGGGGGGAGSGTTASLSGSNYGGNGGNTTFGTSLLTANGGSGGTVNAGAAAGGSATVNSPAIQIVAISGESSTPGALQFTASSQSIPSGNGAVSPFGGAGVGGVQRNRGRR